MMSEEKQEEIIQDPLMSAELDAEERKKVIFYYVFFFGSAAMICIPLVYPALVGLIVCSLTLVGMYSAKSSSEEEGYMESHMTFLIHTFWYAGIFMFYSIIAAMIYILGFANYLNFYECIQSLPKIAFNAARYADLSGLIEASGICWQSFVNQNEFHLMVSKIIACTPIFIYLMVRFVKGWTLAVKHTKIVY